MRAWLAIIAVLALGATPVVAQGKTKASRAEPSVQVLDMCERFALGDVLAVQAAIEDGWQAEETESGTPYMRAFSGSKTIAGLGNALMTASIERYDGKVMLGFCRVDVKFPESDGNIQIQAVQNLDRYEGTSQMISAGNFAGLTGRGDPNRMLLVHQDAENFVLQLTIITPGAEARP